MGGESFVLLCLAVIIAVVSSTVAVSREQIINNVIKEVKLSEILNEVQMQDQSAPNSPSQLLRAFKRPSKGSNQNWESSS